VVTNSGAYGPHGMTAAGAIGKKPLPLYTHTPNIHFEMDAVHTNLPIAGAMRGYGAPQGHFAVEGHIDEVARKLDIDPIDFRAQNCIGEGDLDIASGILKDGEYGRRIRSCGLKECIERGSDAIGWN